MHALKSVARANNCSGEARLWALSALQVCVFSSIPELNPYLFVCESAYFTMYSVYYIRYFLHFTYIRYFLHFTCVSRVYRKYFNCFLIFFLKYMHFIYINIY